MGMFAGTSGANSAHGESSCDQLVQPPRGASRQRVAEATRCRPRRASRRRPAAPARVVRATLRPSRRSGSDTRAATSPTCASAIARTAGPETPPVPPPSHGSAGSRGSRAMPRSVLISETASAPCCLGGRGDLARRRAVGRQLDDQRLGRVRADRVEQAGDLARVGADHQPGLDVRAGDVELERGDLVALAEGLDERRDLLAR